MIDFSVGAKSVIKEEIMHLFFFQNHCRIYLGLIIIIIIILTNISQRPFFMF